MPKMKTRKGIAKRCRISGSGKVLYKKQGSRHILTKKSAKRKRNLRQTGILSPAELKTVRRMMPYG